MKVSDYNANTIDRLPIDFVFTYSDLFIQVDEKWGQPQFLIFGFLIMKLFVTDPIYLKGLKELLGEQ